MSLANVASFPALFMPRFVQFPACTSRRSVLACTSVCVLGRRLAWNDCGSPKLPALQHRMVSTVRHPGNVRWVGGERTGRAVVVQQTVTGQCGLSRRPLGSVDWAGGHWAVWTEPVVTGQCGLSRWTLAVWTEPTVTDDPGVASRLRCHRKGE